MHLLDSRLRLHVPDALEETARRLLVPCPGEGVPLEHDVRVVEGGVQVDGGTPSPAPSTPAGLLEQVLAAVNALVIGDLRSPAVHAGVVALDGAVLTWPGVSGAGKTTLTAACLRAGFAYVSDEALVLDVATVRPYPKPLSLDAWSLAAVGLDLPEPGATERAVLPAELGAQVAPAPLVPTHVLRLRRRTGPPTLQPVSRAETAMLLVEHAFNHWKDPVATFTRATRAVRTASCWELGYDEPLAAAALLRERAG